jgi:hypothetical protein
MRHVLAVLFLIVAVTLAMRAAAEYRPGTGALPAPHFGGQPDPGNYVPPVNVPPATRSFPTPAPYPGAGDSRSYSTAPEGIYPPEGSAAYGSGFDRLDPRGKLPKRD